MSLAERFPFRNGFPLPFLTLPLSYTGANNTIYNFMERNPSLLLEKYSRKRLKRKDEVG